MLPIADVPYLKRLLRVCRKVFKDDPKKMREFFFTMSLVGMYDCMWDGIKVEVGHIIYCLSDFLDETERRQIDIYPSPEGSLVDVETDTQWDSLEDWRRQWASMHPVIPEFDFTKKLRARKLLALPTTFR